MTILYILFAILIFSFLIFVHELGHFLAAKRLGVQVNEFAICMGPVLWQKKKGETVYSIRAIPIGGFCAMEGEDEDSQNPRAFTSVAWWRRMIILVAGSFMNFAAGFLIVLILMSSYGAIQNNDITRIYDGAAIGAPGGLQEGDVFYKIDGERVYIEDDIRMLLERNSTGVFDLVVLRGGEKVFLNDYAMEKQYFEIDGETRYLYGFEYGSVADKTVGSVLRYSWNNSMDFVRLVRLGLQDLLTGKVGVNDMSGPVGIVSVITQTGESAQTVGMGVVNVLYLAAFIAINLAVMNMLPIPALDGGRVLCLLLTTAVENLTRKKLNPKYEGYLHAAGMIVLLAFMAYVSFHDIFKLFKG